MNTPQVKKLARAISCLLFCACNSVIASDLACTPNTKISLPTIHADVIAIGELHGSNEIPAFVGGLVCQLAMSEKPVVLGLELPMDLQVGINKYTLSKGQPEDKLALLSADFYLVDSTFPNCVNYLNNAPAPRWLQINTNEQVDMSAIEAREKFHPVTCAICTA